VWYTGKCNQALPGVLGSQLGSYLSPHHSVTAWYGLALAVGGRHTPNLAWLIKK